MSEAYSNQGTNIVAIQAAVLDIVLNRQATYTFASSGLDRVPTPQELQPQSVTGTTALGSAGVNAVSIGASPSATTTFGSNLTVPATLVVGAAVTFSGGSAVS